MISEEVQADRSRVIDYLRNNPEGFLKIEGEPANEKNGRCLVGMVCEALDFSLDNYVPGSGKAYDFAQERTATDVDLLWGYNDRHKSATWEDMADVLEKVWKENEEFVLTLELPVS